MIPVESMQLILQRGLIAVAALLVLPLLVVQFFPAQLDNAGEEAAALIGADLAPEHAYTAKGNPELYFEVHHEIRASENGRVEYPMGYRQTEYQKAMAALKTQQPTLSWVERGPGNVGGRTRPLVVDPDDPTLATWYVGTAGGGVWWTNNRGYAWGYLTDNMPAMAVSALVQAPSNPDIMYAGTGEGFGNLDGPGGLGVMKSYDRGQTWEQLLSTSSDSLFRDVNRLAVSPDDPDIVVAATNFGIYRTTDGGATWTETYSRAGDFGFYQYSRIQDLQAQPGNFNTMIAGENPGGILHSTDGGQTWSYGINEADIFGGNLRIELAYAPSDPSIAYASVQLARGGAGLLRSDNGGMTWGNTLDASPFPLNWLGGQGWYDNTIAVHPFAPDTVFLGGIFLWRAKMTGNVVDLRAPTGFQIFLPDQEETTVRYISGLGNVLGNVVLHTIEDTSFTDVVEEDYSSVEIRYGQGTQMAHRFTSNDSTSADVACFFLPYGREEYQDYVEVPFTVWDIDSGKQLEISFRDTARDSVFNLIAFNINGACDGVSNEQLYVHKYEYDGSAPHDSIAQNGGTVRGATYMLLPFDPIGGWDPDNLPPQTTRIVYSRADGLYEREMDGLLDPTVDTHVDHHAIVPIGIDQASDNYWVLNTNDGGVAISIDEGESFFETDVRFAGYNTGQFYGADKRPGVPQYVGGLQDNGSWMSYGNPNNRRGWISVFGADGFEANWNQRDENKIVTSFQFNGLNYTTNRGTDWNLNFFLDDPGIFLTSLDSSPLAPDTLYIIGQLGVWKSVDWAETWTLAPMDSAWGPSNIGKVRASAAADSIVWAGYGLDDDPERTLWHSTDAGETWKPSALPTMARAPRTITSGLATHPTEAGTAYALFSRYQFPKILETTDFGQTWQDISGFAESTNHESVRGFPDAAVYDLLVMPHAPHVMWAGTDLGIFKSKSRGKEWNYAHNGLPAVSVYRLKYRDDEVVVATHGRGVWTVPAGEIDVSISDDRVSDLPTSFVLEQNYPNPFNASTTITFSVPEESNIRLTVFDALGRRVGVITDQPYSAGVHELVWDANALASGVYFYRMEAAGKLIHTQKMTLVK